MKALAVWLLGVVLVPVVALAQAPAADLNTISGVQVNGGTVTINGTKKPNFTTFTMTDPPRLVIDISEAVFSNVPEEMQVGNGTVTGIRTASYGSDASAIARVLIGYEREVETDIQANGNQLVVRVAGGGGQAVAQAPAQPEAAPAAQPTTDGSSAQAAAAAEADRQAQEKAAADAAAAARADREAQEKAAAEAAARAQADAEAERKRQEEARAAAQRQESEARAAADAAAEEKKRQEAEARASAQAAADEKKRQEAEARASAQAAEEERRAAAQAAAEEKKRQQEEARAAAKSAADERRAAAQAAAEERRAEQEAAAEEKKRQQEEARAARASRKSEAVAMATPRESERLEVSGGSSGPVEVSSRRKTMTLVGFQQQSGASRVFVRTNEPVRYTVSEEGGAVVLELENTRIDLSNNTRPLDTSFFNSPVTRVDADASGRAVRVTIQLRQQAPYQARQDGDVISLDFQRTGR
ncbi:AMIN domain-containing protein [Myxococcus sp. RHSTA-1-4]|uniref:AMIN domain-containing protein n=1 Tax=Myxococcus sp. RHSTA-1-4 TaxID=2874601 RepID=UPI001CC0F8E3|nr:AMIN domain-containing protein [Myxococcus sp. RHSTA-1-4]MBZ4415578.1 AMIN domain-containing protein [Myxococcus sp. RHSTA-1-4]